MDCKYHVYINTMDPESLEATIQAKCQNLMTGIELKNEYPVTDVIVPREYKIDWNLYSRSKKTGNEYLKHVIMINDPKIVWVDFISNNELMEHRTIESEGPDDNKLFLADFDIATEHVTIRCYGEGKEVLFIATVYFLSVDGSRPVCGEKPIPGPSMRIRGIANNGGFVNFMFNPWDVDSTHAFILIDDMPVEYASSNGGTNMISLRSPAPDSVALIVQIKDDNIVSWVKRKFTTNQGVNQGFVIPY